MCTKYLLRALVCGLRCAESGLSSHIGGLSVVEFSVLTEPMCVMLHVDFVAIFGLVFNIRDVNLLGVVVSAAW